MQRRDKLVRNRERERKREREGNGDFIGRRDRVALQLEIFLVTSRFESKGRKTQRGVTAPRSCSSGIRGVLVGVQGYR